MKLEDPINQTIVKRLIEGSSAKEIASEVFLTKQAIHWRILRLRILTGTKNIVAMTHVYKNLVNIELIES